MKRPISLVALTLAVSLLGPTAVAQAETIDTSDGTYYSDPDYTFTDISDKDFNDLTGLEAINSPAGGYGVDGVEGSNLDEYIPVQPSMLSGGGATTMPVRPNASTTAFRWDKYNCVLHPSEVHLRTSSNYATVAAKPYTNCSFGTPSRIIHDTTLVMVEWAGLVNRKIKSQRQDSFGPTKSMTFKNFEWVCQNRNRSRFAQKTVGTSTQAGKNYYSLVWTPRSHQDCGRR